MQPLKQFIKKVRRITMFPLVLQDYSLFKKESKKNKRFSINFKDIYPCPFDKTIFTGFDRHYVFHTAWAARKLKEINPKHHIDIASSLYFSTITSAFIPITFYDVRPAEITMPNLESQKADLCNLPFDTNSIESISCMHTIEHVGLGRYGDPIDPEADLKAIEELIRVLSPNGSLLFVTPVGQPKIEFNAHRIYSYEQIMEYFNELDLKEFSLIPDNSKDGTIIFNADPSLVHKQKYACGCFWFIKK